MQRKLRRKTKDTKSEDGAFKVNTESVPDAVNTDLETTAIYVLTTLFGLILLNGLVLAAAVSNGVSVGHSFLTDG